MVYNVFMFCLLIFGKLLKIIMSLFRRAIDLFFLSFFLLGSSGKRRQVADGVIIFRLQASLQLEKAQFESHGPSLVAQW